MSSQKTNSAIVILAAQARPDVSAGRRLYDFDGVSDRDVVRALTQRALHLSATETLDSHLQELGSLAWVKIVGDEVLVAPSNENSQQPLATLEPMLQQANCEFWAWEMTHSIAPLVLATATKNGVPLAPGWATNRLHDLCEFWPRPGKNYSNRLAHIAQSLGLNLPSSGDDSSDVNRATDLQLMASALLFLRNAKVTDCDMNTKVVAEHIAVQFSNSASPTLQAHAEAFRAAA